MIGTWVLIIWFASSSNYTYVPTVIDGFESRIICERAAKTFTDTDSRYPKAVCVSKK